MRTLQTTYLFGYGSLVYERNVRDFLELRTLPCAGRQVARLRGYRRTWNVAMDNATGIPGYKYYVDATTGKRPECQVGFINITSDQATTIEGVLLSVAVETLDIFDRRELYYDRVDITDCLDPEPREPVWTYVGNAVGRAIYERGRASGTAVVVQSYVRDIEEGYRTLGSTALTNYRATTDLIGVPIRELKRIDDV